MWKTPVKHQFCALSFKIDNRAAHAVAGMIAIFEVFDLRVRGQNLMDFVFEFALAEAVYDADLNLAFHDGIVQSGFQGIQLKFDCILIILLAAFELSAIDMQIYLLTKHGRIALAATHGIGSTHHIASQKIRIEFL